MIHLTKTNRLFLLVGQIFCTCLVAFATVFPVATAHAHPIEYHRKPLNAEGVQRVLASFDLLMGELRNADTLNAARIPANAMGVTLMLWSVQDAIADADETAPSDSPSLKRSLNAAGYKDSPYMVDEWQIEAERVLETYEVLQKGLTQASVIADYAAFKKEASGLSEEQAVNRQRILVRNSQLVRTTSKDLALVSEYRKQLDALVEQFASGSR